MGTSRRRARSGSEPATAALERLFETLQLPVPRIPAALRQGMRCYPREALDHAVETGVLLHDWSVSHPLTLLPEQLELPGVVGLMPGQTG